MEYHQSTYYFCRMLFSKNIVFLLLVALIALSHTGTFLLVKAEGEAEGECVAGADGETCVNPEEAAAAEAAAAAAQREEAERQEQLRRMEEEEAARERERREQEQRQAEVEAAAAAEREEAERQEQRRRMEEEEQRQAEEAEQEAKENTPNCPSRKHVIKCAGEYLDTNGNGMLDRVELQSAIDKLPWLSRGVLSILGSVDKMMAKCDVDGDDAISYGCPGCDMENNGETCLATCFKRRAFKSAFFADCKA